MNFKISVVGINLVSYVDFFDFIISEIVGIVIEENLFSFFKSFLEYRLDILFVIVWVRFII